MQRITRWILKLNDKDELIIRKKRVSKHMPINRMIEDVGHYQYDFIEIKDTLYMYVFYPEEIDTIKSAVMIGKFNKLDSSIQMTDMTVDDLQNLDIFYKQFFTAKCYN